MIITRKNTFQEVVKSKSLEERKFRCLMWEIHCLIGKNCYKISHAITVIKKACDNISFISEHSKKMVKLYIKRCDHIIRVIYKNPSLCNDENLNIDDTIEFFHESSIKMSKYLN